MWKIAQELLGILVVIMILSQVIWPVLVDKPMFWMFRREKKKVSSKEGEAYDFDAEVEALDETLEKREKSLDEIMNEIDTKAERLNELKNKKRKP